MRSYHCPIASTFFHLYNVLMSLGTSPDASSEVFMLKPVVWIIVVLSLVGLLGCQGSQETVEEEIPPLITDPVPDHAGETLAALFAADPPQRDLDDLAQRLLGVNVPTSVSIPDYKVGDVDDFWYKEAGTVNKQISAELKYQSPMLNMWIEDGARASDSKITEAAELLESSIIPKTRSFFGTENSPGIDGDERINILHLKEIGGSGGTTAVGYFYVADQYPTVVNEYSNEREIFYISLRQAPIASDAYYKVIAHEFQHMIHANTDRNEPAWMDEGLAELSNSVNGYTDVDSISAFSDLPDVQLNSWSNGTQYDIAHYGASFLFNAYFLDKYGESATKEVVSNEKNGFGAFDDVLAQVDAGVTSDDLFAGWVTDTYLASRGINAYGGLDVDEMAISAELSSSDSYSGVVHQYGTDYIKIDGGTVNFKGSSQTAYMDTEPTSGNYFLTTLSADRSDMYATRTFDLTATQEQTVTLSFMTWYEIEAGWDYGYTLVSPDDGATWDQLDSIYHTRANPQGNNYGAALTANSGIDTKPVWAEINLDLTPYKGKEILIRFEYVTDDAVFEEGWAIDDIRIDATGYFEDFESGTGDWQTAGWARHANVLPQTYIVQAIYIDGESARTERFALNDDQTGTFTLDSGDEVILAISGNTPITTQKAAYDIEITP